MPNPVVHFEVHGKDRKKSEKFFSDLFGWHVESLDEMSYGMIDTHGGDHGINGGIAETECWQPAKVGHFETREIRDRERAW